MLFRIILNIQDISLSCLVNFFNEGIFLFAFFKKILMEFNITRIEVWEVYKVVINHKYNLSLFSDKKLNVFLHSRQIVQSLSDFERCETACIDFVRLIAD